jgi:ADP-ribose pyrophosphatase
MTTASHTTPGTMRNARLVETEVLLPKPKRFVREALVMPDGYELDWYYVDTPPSVMIVPVTGDGDLVLVRQYRHNLKAYALEFPAGTVSEGEDPQRAALRELEEETGFTLAPGAELRPLGAYYSLPSETNKYTHVFVAEPVAASGPATGDTEIEKYFDMSVIVMPFSAALEAVGDSITGTETVTALMLAHHRRLRPPCVSRASRA